MTTPDNTPTKATFAKKPAQSNKYPSRVNCPLRGGKINVVCEDHRNEVPAIKEDQAWIEKKKTLLLPFLESSYLVLFDPDVIAQMSVLDW